MNWRTTLVLLIIVVFFAVFVGFFEHKNKSMESRQQDAKLVVPGFKELQKAVNHIVIERPYDKVKVTAENRNGERKGPVQRIELLKTGEDTWNIISPINYPADRYRSDGLITGLINLDKNPVQLGKEDALALTPKEGNINPAEYGLDKDSRVRIAFYQPVKPGTSVSDTPEEKLAGEVYLSGQEVLGGGAVYAAVPGLMNKEVYIVGNSLYSEAMAPLDELRDHRIFGNLSFSKVTSATLTRPGSTVAFLKRETQWDVVKPIRDIGKYSSIDDAVSSVVSLFLDDFVEDNPEDLVQYGLDKPRYKIAISDIGGNSYVLDVGRDIRPDDPEAKPENTYVMMEGRPSVLRVNNKFIEKLSMPVNDFRFEKLLVLQSEKVSRIFIQRADVPQGLDLRQTGGDWKFTAPAPHDADESAVNNLIADIKDIGIIEYLPDMLPPSEERLSAAGAVKAFISYDQTAGMPPVQILLVPATADKIQAWRILPEGINPEDAPYDPKNAFLVSKSAYAALMTPVLALRSRDIAGYNKAEASRVELTTPAGKHVAVKQGDKWRLEQPNGAIIDEPRLDDIFWRSANLRAELLVGEYDKPEDLPRFGLGDGAIELKILAGDITLALILGNETPKGTFAKLAGVNMVFLIPSGDNGLEQLCRDGLVKGAKLYPRQEQPAVQTPPVQPPVIGPKIEPEKTGDAAPPAETPVPGAVESTQPEPAPTTPTPEPSAEPLTAPASETPVGTPVKESVPTNN